MKKYTAVIACSTFLLFFQGSAFAAGIGIQCLDRVTLTYVNIGYNDSQGSIFADIGNSIHFGYKNPSGGVSDAQINLGMNLNDGGKGISMYHILNSALSFGYKVSAWAHNMASGENGGDCNQIDEVRVHVEQ
ncbi:hypothetical protein [Aeromonas jandaei]|uniref:hypothetical protein n=1 Tax=Aeromonas jandaei TaxID=650 RepID=UPI003EC8EEF8